MCAAKFFFRLAVREGISIEICAWGLGGVGLMAVWGLACGLGLGLGQRFAGPAKGHRGKGRARSNYVSRPWSFYASNKYHHHIIITYQESRLICAHFGGGEEF